jgi:TATA-box binding protein (TBP) (component of TFIID and TFIIIB)
MSFDNKNYMVEFKSGKTVHVGAEDIQEVKQYCADEYPSNVIDTIYLNVFETLEQDNE